MNIARTPWTVENEECDDIISDDLIVLSASPEFRMVATISRCFQGDRIPGMEAEHARLIAAAPELLKAASDAYSRLLSLGQYEGRCTIKGQAELASLVDAIATATGRTPQDVQDEFEAREVMRVPA